MPPEGWENPTQFEVDSTKKFATKLQRMSTMGEGRAMGDGNFFTYVRFVFVIVVTSFKIVQIFIENPAIRFRQYEKRANDFREEWIAKNYEDSNATFDDLENDYWRLIKNQYDGDDVKVGHEFHNSLVIIA